MRLDFYDGTWMWIDRPNKYLRTVFADGAELAATPNPDADADTCLRLGLDPGHAEWLWLTHDLLHNWLAAQRSRQSITLYEVAHNAVTDTEAHYREEAAVLCLQARGAKGPVTQTGPLIRWCECSYEDTVLLVIHAKIFLKGYRLLPHLLFNASAQRA